MQQMAVAQARGALQEIATQGETSRDGVLGRRGTVTWDAQLPARDDLRRDTRGSSARDLRGSSAGKNEDLEAGRPFWKNSTGSPFASPARTKTVKLPPAAESANTPKRATLWSTIDPFDSYRSGLTVGDDDDPKWDEVGVDGKRRGTTSIDPGANSRLGRCTSSFDFEAKVRLGKVVKCDATEGSRKYCHCRSSGIQCRRASTRTECSS